MWYIESTKILDIIGVSLEHQFLNVHMPLHTLVCICSSLVLCRLEIKIWCY